MSVNGVSRSVKNDTVRLTFLCGPCAPGSRYDRGGVDRILLIDDDVEFCGLVQQYLQPEGFELDAAHDGAAGLALARDPRYAIVIVDVMLPDQLGFDVLRRLRAQGAVPVLMLTARGEDLDRILGLELGADDYLPKPFNPRELAARLRAILRRTRRPPDASAPIRPPLRVGDVELNPGARTVRRGDRAIDLTTVEFDLLDTLLFAAGQVMPRDVLVKRVLGREFSPFDRSIDVHIANLRRKLGPLPPDGGERIKGVRGVGYLYVAPIASATNEKG
jgi:two-component system response regulator CpxR